VRAGSERYSAEVISDTPSKLRQSHRPVHPTGQEQEASPRFVSRDEFDRTLEGVIASTKDILRAMSDKLKCLTITTWD